MAESSLDDNLVSAMKNADSKNPVGLASNNKHGPKSKQGIVCLDKTSVAKKTKKSDNKVEKMEDKCGSCNKTVDDNCIMCEDFEEHKLQFSRQLITLLNELGCPLTEILDEHSLSDKLWTPGEFRLRLLCWIFSRFDIGLSEYLDSVQSSSVDQITERRVDTTAQALLKIAASLRLCAVDDISIITGERGGVTQLSFMSRLFDWLTHLELPSSSDQSPVFLSSDLASTSSNKRLRKQFEADSALIDALVSKQPISRLLSNRVNVIPPEIGQQIEIDRKKGTAQHMSTTESNNMSVEYLESEIERLKQEVEIRKQELNKISGRQVDSVSDSIISADSSIDSIPDTLKQTIRLVLGDLSQIITNFSCLYDNDLKHWVNGRTGSQVSDVGSKFKQVHDLVTQFTEVTISLDKIIKSESSLSVSQLKRVNQLKDQLIHTTHHSTSNNKDKTTRPINVLDSLQSTVSELERSVSRVDLNQSAASIPFSNQLTSSLQFNNQSTSSIPFNNQSAASLQFLNQSASSMSYTSQSGASAGTRLTGGGLSSHGGGVALYNPNRYTES